MADNNKGLSPLTSQSTKNDKNPSSQEDDLTKPSPQKNEGILAKTIATLSNKVLTQLDSLKNSIPNIIPPSIQSIIFFLKNPTKIITDDVEKFVSPNDSNYTKYLIIAVGITKLTITMFVKYSTHILTLKDRNSSEYYNIFVEYYGNIILLLNQKLGFSDDTRQKIIESINDISKNNKNFIPDENGISDIQTKNTSLNSDNSDAFIKLSKDNLGLSLSIVKSFSSGNNDELIKNIQTLTKNNIQLYMKVTGKSDYQNIHDKFIVPLVSKIQTWPVDSSDDVSNEESTVQKNAAQSDTKQGGKRKTKRRRTRKARTKKNKKRKTNRHRR